MKNKNTRYKRTSNNVIDIIYKQLIRKRSHATFSITPKSKPPHNLPNIKRPKFPNTKETNLSNAVNTPNSIFISFYDEAEDKPICFADALKKIKQQEKINKGEEIVYIGAGEFAVIAYTKKNKQTIPKIVRKIPFEKHTDNSAWRDDLCYELSLSHKLTPAPVSELYTNEEHIKYSHLNNT